MVVYAQLPLPGSSQMRPGGFHHALDVVRRALQKGTHLDAINVTAQTTSTSKQSTMLHYPYDIRQFRDTIFLMTPSTFPLQIQALFYSD